MDCNMEMETEERKAFHFIAYLKAVSVAAVTYNIIHWLFLLPAILETPAANTLIWVAAFAISLIGGWVFAFFLNIIPVFLATCIARKYKLHDLRSYAVTCVGIVIMNMVVAIKILAKQSEAGTDISSYGRLLPAFILAGILSAVTYWRVTHKKLKTIKQSD